MKNTLKKLWTKYEEIIRYIIVGGLTTVVSLVSYFILVATILDANNPKELQLANIISWILSVTFAFYANRKYVFKSTKQDVGSEMVDFYMSRVGTLIIDMLTMFVLVTAMGMNDTVAKIIVQFIVLVLNYVFSKLFVFSKKQTAQQRSYTKVFRTIKQTICDKDFFIPFFICLLLFGVFAHLNFAPDTYFDIMRDEQVVLNGAFLLNGRFITAIFISILKKLSLGVGVTYALTYATAILATTTSIYLLKKKLMDRWIRNQTLSLFISTIIIANPFSLELFVFFEKGAMLLSVLFCVLGAIYFQKYLDDKKAKYAAISLLFAFASTCCYQGTLGLYITLLTIINVLSKQKIGQFIKNSAISVALYVTAPVCDIILAKLIAPGGRVGNGIRIFESISKIAEQIWLLLKSFYIVPMGIIYVLAGAAMITTIVMALRKKDKKANEIALMIAQMIYLAIVTTLAAVAPYMAQSTDTIWVVPRSSYVFGAMIGIMSCIFYAGFKKPKWKMTYVLPIIYCVVLLVLEAYNFVAYGIDNYIVTRLDMQRAKEVKAAIEEYEQETGAKIEKIASYADADPQPSYENVRVFSDVNVSAFPIQWANVDLINYWTDSNYKLVEDETYEKKCQEIDNDTHDGDLVLFYDDTAVICLY